MYLSSVIFPIRALRCFLLDHNNLLKELWKFPFLVFLIAAAIACQKEPLEDVPGDEEDPEVILGLPELLTHEISDISIYSVTAGGAILDTGYSQVIEQGLVIDTLANPTLEKNLNSFSLPVDSNGIFTTAVVHIPPGKVFYFRSYAINSEGTGYGNEVTFRSLEENMIWDNIELTTQEEVIEFGSHGYNKIRGSLNIGGTVNDLTPLKDLVVVTSNFHINSSMISDFQGLENLRIIGDEFAYGFRVENNSQLESFEGLDNLDMINGDFLVGGNNLLKDFSGLETLMGVYMGGLLIRECAGLKSLSGLDNLRFIGYNLLLYNNPLLSDISALVNLEVFIGGIRIEGNSALTTLNGLEAITDIERIVLISNDNLCNLEGLGNLETVSKLILIRNNNSLETIPIFNKIAITQSLQIEDNDVLKSFDGLSELQSVPNSISIVNNPELVNVDGLSKLSQARYLVIASNDNLSDITGLSNLTSMNLEGTHLGINSNSNLVTLDGLEGLSRVDGYFAICGNERLEDFCALKPLFTSGRFEEILILDNLVNPSPEDVINNCQ